MGESIFTELVTKHKAKMGLLGHTYDPISKPNASSSRTKCRDNA